MIKITEQHCDWTDNHLYDYLTIDDYKNDLMPDYRLEFDDGKYFIIDNYSDKVQCRAIIEEA